jgi:hypothetical protein
VELADSQYQWLCTGAELCHIGSLEASDRRIRLPLDGSRPYATIDGFGPS